MAKPIRINLNKRKEISMTFKPKKVRVRIKASPESMVYRCNAYHGESIMMGSCKSCGKHAVLRNHLCQLCAKQQL